MLDGTCHCGAITVTLATTRAPADLPVRVCGCTFCLRHRPRYTSDPSGQLTIRAASADALSRYRFGLRLADFLICRTCGVFVAGFEPEPALAVLNLLTLTRAADFTAEPVHLTIYDTEDVPARTARRARAWMPATLVIG